MEELLAKKKAEQEAQSKVNTSRNLPEGGLDTIITFNFTFNTPVFCLIPHVVIVFLLI